jgi:hypothetical protein
MPRDTSRRLPDSAIFALPRRDTMRLRPRDSLTVRDSLRRRPPRPPDTSRVRFRNQH